MSADPSTELLIGGESVAGAGEPLEVENPYTEQTLASVAAASSEQTDAAIAAARGRLDGLGHDAGRRARRDAARGRHRLRANPDELAARDDRWRAASR